jgi:hypothetical protein
MKIAIVGSRNFKDIQKIKDLVNSFPADTIIISGGAPGVDTAAELAGKARGLQVLSIKAEWNDLSHSDAFIKIDSYGKKYDAKAGHRRNEDIIKAADEIYAFWDGVSKGTLNSIGHARRLNKKITIILPD